MNAVMPLNKYPTDVMTEEQTNIMLSCMMAPADKLQCLSDDMVGSHNFLWLVFTERAKSVGLNLELKLVAFVVLGMLRNPAQSTQLLHAIYHDVIGRAGVSNEQEECNAEALEAVYTLDNFVHMFPMGLPSEKVYEQAWRSQKCDSQKFGTDNLLDTHAFFYRWVG